MWLAFGDLGVAIPTIADKLDASTSQLEWANNAFSLVCGALVIAAGKFGDVFGRRSMLQIGSALFAGFSIVAALAGSVGVLIAGRGLMGIGAALILPATLALIPPQFSGKAALTAFGVWQATAWGGQAVGPAIGGGITDALGWQWLFWLNLPFAAVALVVIHRLTPESRDPNAPSHIDWAGLVTIGLAVFALLYALTDGPAVGWTQPHVIALFVAAVALAVGWCVIELRVHDPLVDFRLFRMRPYDGALTANLTMNLAFAGLSYLLVLWLQDVRGYSPVTAGLLMLPSTLGIFCFIPLGGRMAGRVGGRPPVLIGLAVMSAGFFVLGFLSSNSTVALIAVSLIVVGIGLGILSTPISNTAVGEVPEELAGTAAGVFKMSSMVGGALGVALLTAFARAYAPHHAQEAARAAGLSDADVEKVRNALVNSKSFGEAISSLPHDLAARVTRAAEAAFSSGVADAMVTTGAIGIAAAAIVYFLWPRGRPA